MEALLDFSKPVDVTLLDRVVLTFFDATNPQVRVDVALQTTSALANQRRLSRHGVVYDGT